MWSTLVNSGDNHLRDYYLMKSPLSIITALGFYLYFIYKLGPSLMENRRPMTLKYTMTMYNIIQIVCNALLVYNALPEIIRTSSSLNCILYLSSPDGISIAHYIYLYLVLKILDLVDTVFFVLRKKQNQISFLHVYHHTSMILFTWVSAKWQPGGHIVWAGVVNTMVHCVMYFYYTLTIWQPNAKSTFWWKKYLTQIQMVQHAAVGMSMAGAFLNPHCDYPKIYSSIATLQAVIFFVLFAKFYRKCYSNQDKKQH